MRSLVRNAGAMALLLLAVAAAGPRPAAAAVRTIYSSLPLVGQFRAQSEDVLRGERLALEQAGGRVGDVELRLRSLNDGNEVGGWWDPGATSANARRAAEDRSAIAYIGEFHSGASAISMPVLNTVEMLQMSPSATYVGLTRREGSCCGEPQKHRPMGRPNFGRVAPADHLQAAAIARYLQLLGARDVFVVDDAETYSKGVGAMVRRRLAARGLALSGRAVLRSRGGAAAIAEQIRRARPSALFFSGITDNGAVRLWRAVHRRNPRLLLVGSHALAEPAFTRRLPRSAAHRTFITVPTLPARAYPPAAQAFHQAFRDRHGHAPAPYAIYGYETMALILDCIRRAGPRGGDRSAVLDEFFATRDRDSVLGRYSIDRFGDTTLSTYGGYRVSPGGRLVYDRTIDSAQ